MVKVYYNKEHQRGSEYFSYYFKFDILREENAADDLVIILNGTKKTDILNYEKNCQVAIVFSKNKFNIPDKIEYVIDNTGRSKVVCFNFDITAILERLHNIYQDEANSDNVFINKLHDVIQRILSAEKLPIRLVQLRPRNGKKYYVNLSHDVDFFRLRNYLWSPTMVGVLKNSFIRLIKERRTADAAAFYGALIREIMIGGDALWNSFDDYIEMEQRYGLSSIFYVVPDTGKIKRAPSIMDNMPKISKRLVKYNLKDIISSDSIGIDRINFGIHGYNSWYNRSWAAKEKAYIENFLKRSVDHIRMHWLFWSNETAEILSKEGYRTDSTLGYNNRIGFKTSSTYPFFFVGSDLLELPLNIMDTALMLRKKLSKKAIFDKIRQVLRNFSKYGGILTVNWHNRSLAYDRGWNQMYRELLEEIIASGGMGVNIEDAYNICMEYRMSDGITIIK